MENIPAFLNFTYIALLLITALAIPVVFRKTVKNSSAKRKYIAPILLLGVWVVLSVVASKGIFLDTIKNIPPAFVPAVFTTAAFAVYFALYYKPLHEFADSNMKYAVAIQTFRLPLELIFVWLLAHNLMPVQMTFEGRNFDVLVGLTAPFIAYFGYHKTILPKWALIAWNFVGLGLLINIVTVAILSAPVSFQVFTNLPHNTIVFKPPYHFIPFFLVPLALFGHLFALKRLLKK